MHLVQQMRTVLTPAPPLPRALTSHGARHASAHRRVRGTLATLNPRTLDASPTLPGPRRVHPRPAADRVSPLNLPAQLALRYNSSSLARQQGTAPRAAERAPWAIQTPYELSHCPLLSPRGPRPLEVLALPHPRNHLVRVRSLASPLDGPSPGRVGALRSHTRTSNSAPLTGALAGRAGATWRAPSILLPSPRGRHFDVRCSRGDRGG